MQQFQEKFQFELALTTLTSAFLQFAQPDVVGGGFWFFKRTNHAVFAKCCACFLEFARHLAYVSKPFLATSAA